MLRDMLLGNRIKPILRNYNLINFNYSQTIYDLKPPWKVLFFGSDEFAVASLKALQYEHKIGSLLNNLEVVTSIKKNSNPVEKYAKSENLVTHNWSKDISNCDKFDIGVVVSFGHLIPANIINSFYFGMLNVHASLLPRWRGAAPIIHSIANGDLSTGITIMKIKADKFDVGEIVTQVSVPIPPHVKMPAMYDTLALLGAQTLINTLRNLPENLENALPQPKEGVTLAPKITNKMAHLDWNKMPANKVYNLDRALTGITQLNTNFNNMLIKLYNVSCCESANSNEIIQVVPGCVKYDKKKKTLQIQCADGKWVQVDRVGIPGKKITATDFNNGFLRKCNFELRVFR